ncbi:MAG: class I SAM-dependent methyltransferase [Armatimonadetes bacterium]|nr:class I SAM-dependent methyltransferase [Armatimonadota bacterium]
MRASALRLGVACVLTCAATGLSVCCWSTVREPRSTATTAGSPPVPPALALYDAEEYHALFAMIHGGDPKPLRVLRNHHQQSPAVTKQALADLLLNDRRSRTAEALTAATYLYERRARLETTLQFLLHQRCGENRKKLQRELQLHPPATYAALLAQWTAEGVRCPFDGSIAYRCTADGSVVCPRNGSGVHVEPADRGLWSILSDYLYPRTGEVERLQQLVPLTPDSIVIDVGCGLGSYTLPLARIVHGSGRVYAVDIDPELVSFVRYRAAREGARNVIAHHGMAEDLGLPAALADLVLLVDIHVFDPPKRGDLPPFFSMVRALKKGGHLVIMMESTMLPPSGLYESQAAAAGLKLQQCFMHDSPHFTSGRRKYWVFVR